MLIAIGPLGPLAVFLQLLCWIILPALGLIILFTTLHHYARKRKNAAASLEEVKLVELTHPASDGEGAYLFFDHTGLVRDYRDKLSYSHARYTALKSDFQELEKKYKQATITPINPPGHFKSKFMETNFVDAPVVLAPVASEELYLKDLVEEKKAEVAFLQAQLEQRVRKQHEAEAEKEKLKAELASQLAGQEQLMTVKEEQLAVIKLELNELKQQNEMLNAAVADGKDRQEALHDQWEEEQGRANAMEQKLDANKQMLNRLYREFSAYMNEEPRESPVIPFDVAIARDY